MEEFIEVLAPMAGITDGKFCSKMARFNFEILTIGGYNADQRAIDAGLEIINRGRPEFLVPKDELYKHISNEIKFIKKNAHYNGLISVNLRASSPEPMIKLSKITGIDVVEINAHCRQPEMIGSSCGQALLKNADKLRSFNSEVVNNTEKKVSVKIRANVPGVNYLEVVNAVNDAGPDYLHVDAMKPGFDSADYDMVKSIKKHTNIFVIGNNSVKDIESARLMLAAGADGISIARAAIKGTLPYDLVQL